MAWPSLLSLQFWQKQCRLRSKLNAVQYNTLLCSAANCCVVQCNVLLCNRQENAHNSAKCIKVQQCAWSTMRYNASKHYSAQQFSALRKMVCSLVGSPFLLETHKYHFFPRSAKRTANNAKFHPSCFFTLEFVTIYKPLENRHSSQWQINAMGE